jgi:primosomal protein N''
MKTTEIKSNAAVSRIAYFAERLQALVMEAQSEGVQLDIPTIEPKPELKKANAYAEQRVVAMAVPARFDHRYYDRPLFVQARGIIDLRTDDVEDMQLVKPTDLLYVEKSLRPTTTTNKEKQ